MMSTATTPWKALATARVGTGKSQQAVELLFKRSRADSESDFGGHLRSEFFKLPAYKTFDELHATVARLDEEIAETAGAAANAEYRLQRREITAQQAAGLAGKLDSLKQERAAAYGQMTIAHKALAREWCEFVENARQRIKQEALRDLQDGDLLRALTSAAAPYVDQLADAADRFEAAERGVAPDFADIAPEIRVPHRPAI